MMPDQRGNPRVSIFTGGDLYRTPDGERVGRALLIDVSVTGIKVETLEPLEVGEQVFIDFQMKDHIFSRVPVRVERVQSHPGSYLSGLSFQREDVRHRVRQALMKLFEDGPK
jgi:hypothetical protein